MCWHDFTKIKKSELIRTTLLHAAFVDDYIDHELSACTLVQVALKRHGFSQTNLVFGLSQPSPDHRRQDNPPTSKEANEQTLCRLSHKSGGGPVTVCPLNRFQRCR